MERRFCSPTKSVVLLLTLILLTIWTPLGTAQSSDPQNPDLQQLKKKMEQLEQEMQDLKQQIERAETAGQEKTTGTTPGQAPPPVVRETITETAKSAQKSEPGEEAAPVPPKTIDIYGFVMLDSGYRSGAIDPNWFDVIRPTKMDAFKGEFAPNGSTYFSVRQTRFGVKSSTPTALGVLKTLFEFELFGTGVDAGQTTFRLRHAYGELGQFGAGQTWSPFMDIDVFPNSLEYWGPTGMVFFRNVQARWIPFQKGDSNVVIALERPGATGDGGVYADRIELSNIRPQFKWPDLSGHARIAGPWGHVQVAAIVRKIAWVDVGAQNATSFSGTAIGWGVNTSANVNFTKKDVGRFSVVYGKGVENYMNDAPFDIGVRDTPGAPTPFKGVALPVLGVVSFLDHNWSDKFSSAIGYSLENIYNSNAELPSDFHQGHYALANLLYYPAKGVMVGGEFQFGRRVDFSSGFNVNDYKAQFSFKYNWSRGFTY
jgi:cell division protein FtsB